MSPDPITLTLEVVGLPGVRRCVQLEATPVPRCDHAYTVDASEAAQTIGILAALMGLDVDTPCLSVSCNPAQGDDAHWRPGR